MEHLLKRGDIVRIARRKNCFAVVWEINPKTQKTFLFPLVFDPDFHHRTDIALTEPIFFEVHISGAIMLIGKIFSNVTMH